MQVCEGFYACFLLARRVLQVLHSPVAHAARKSRAYGRGLENERVIGQASAASGCAAPICSAVTATSDGALFVCAAPRSQSIGRPTKRNPPTRLPRVTGS